MIRSALFDKCMVVVLNNEGGYSNDPDDPGGATNKGITQVVYNAYREQKGLPIRSVRLIEDEEVYDIDYSRYWVPMNLEEIFDDLLVLQVFDMGINSGIRTSIKILQRLIGVDDDGYIGPNTLRVIEEYTGNIVDDFKRRRKLFYTALVKKRPVLKKFLKGWLFRVDNTKF